MMPEQAGPRKVGGSGEISDQTRFKYLLAHAAPHSSLNSRLIRILPKRPDLVSNITGYFEKYVRLSKSVGDWLLSEIKGDHLYPAVHSRLISLAEGRLDATRQPRANALIKKLWRPTLRPEVLASVGRWALSAGLITANQAEYALSKKKKKDWWVQSQLIDRLSTNHYGALKIAAILNENLRRRTSMIFLQEQHLRLRYDLFESRGELIEGMRIVDSTPTMSDT
jgi:hypothetical protein